MLEWTPRWLKHKDDYIKKNALLCFLLSAAPVAQAIQKTQEHLVLNWVWTLLITNKQTPRMLSVCWF